MKTKLTHKLWAKIAAYVLLGLSCLGLMVSAAGLFWCAEMNLYRYTLQAVKNEQFEIIAISGGDNLLYDVVQGDESLAAWKADSTSAEYQVLDHRGAVLWTSAGYAALTSDYRYTIAYTLVSEDDGLGGTYQLVEYDGVVNGELPELGENGYFVELKVDTGFPVWDGFAWTNWGLELGYALRYAGFAIGAACLLLTILCFVFLLCAAGHRAGHEELVPGYLSKVPFDLLTAALAGIIAVAFAGAMELWDQGFSNVPLELSLIFLLLDACALLGTGWCASLALRAKLGTLGKNTLLYRLLRLLGRAARFLWRAFLTLLRALPLMWKTLLLLLALSALELMGILLCWWETDNLLILWTVEKLLLCPAVLYLALMLRRLQKGGEELAAGNLDYRQDTRGLFGDFKKHGENLNALSAGMRAAVDRQLKSERMKTELITNVSHDIKTPLTSIVNYVDLLRREPAPDAAQTAEYLEVLERQSRKLKKLTEDLVELSKASTGNLPVNAGRRSVSELLRQVLGEYGERLEQAGLETAPALLEEELFVWGDGTLLWRVLDNLFSNVCKYAQSGTRFYIDARRREERVCLSFKNISRERLNLPAEELMERFVRGDSARGGEGSGLGLHIARSLTELQGGGFVLTVDGDLFKVELSLPAAGSAA